MKPTLQLRISQQLTLTPQLQQAIRLLQLSTQDMHQEIARLLEENPMLEAAEESAVGTFSMMLHPWQPAAPKPLTNPEQARGDGRGAG